VTAAPMNVLAVWLLYFIGQALHVLLTAQLVIRSKLNALQNLSQYFQDRWIPLVCRLFLTCLAFMIVWENPVLFNFEHLIPTFGTQVAMAGILGWFSDSVFDKLVAFIPWLHHELPAVEPPATDGK
jgi:hypothetical protein